MCGHLMTMMRCFYKQPDVDYDLLAWQLRTSTEQAEKKWAALQNKYKLHAGDSSQGDPPEGNDLMLILVVLACMDVGGEEYRQVNYARMADVCDVERSTIQSYCSNFRRKYIGAWFY